MLEGLDKINWAELTHAYGSAADVPDLLRQLHAVPCQGWGDDCALQHLFTNIWHQGTVYEATAYAVPFLYELLQDQSRPDRAMILLLIASIADGASYLDVHAKILGKKDFESKLDVERDWVRQAHQAVAARFDILVGLTEDTSPDVRLSAANVLATLQGMGPRISKILLTMRRSETAQPHRAGILLLLGNLGHKSAAVTKELNAALNSGEDCERVAAAVSLGRLSPDKLPDSAMDAIGYYANKEGAYQKMFRDLPWDFAADFEFEDLLESLHPADPQAETYRLIAAIEAGKANHDIIYELLGLVFPLRKQITSPAHLSPLQMRVVNVLVKAVEAAGERKIYKLSFSSHGLPASRRALRDLAAGKVPVLPDPSLPLISDPSEPSKPLPPNALIVGRRILHRTYGVGTVTSVSPNDKFVNFEVKFDEEGSHRLGIPADGSPWPPVKPPADRG